MTEKIVELIDAELERSDKIWPDFHSSHEGYAVILEEFEEVLDEMKNLKWNVKELFKEIKQNIDGVSRANFIEVYSINTINELIQVAAMAKKYKRLNNVK